MSTAGDFGHIDIVCGSFSQVSDHGPNLKGTVIRNTFCPICWNALHSNILETTRSGREEGEVGVMTGPGVQALNRVAANKNKQRVWGNFIRKLLGL